MERIEPAEAAQHEGTGGARAVNIFEEGVSDDEAAEDEEEIDEDKGMFEEIPRRDMGELDEMQQCHNQRTGAAQSIEGGKSHRSLQINCRRSKPEFWQLFSIA